jgi:hypothetical protein
VEVVLEAEAAAEKPKVRVAVGCADSDPRGPDEGLVVYIDGPDVLAPAGVKKRWSDDQKKNIVEYVEYPIAPGTHTLRISITDCRSLDQIVVVDPIKGAQVSGALQSDRFVLFRGPQGTPGWFRLGLGLWMPAGRVRDSVPEEYSGKFGDVVGSVLEIGTVGRWGGLYVDGSIGKGSFNRDTFSTHYALPNPAKVTWNQLSLRTGPRIPFNVVALGLGVSLGFQNLDLDQVRTGKGSGVFGAFTELDAQPLCDWGLFVLGKVEKPTNSDEPIGAMQAGIFLEPNSQCRKERSTKFGLSQQGR